jgi:hypothetical protein
MENWIEVVTRTGKQLSIQTTFGFQALRKTTHLSCNIMASGVNGVACQVKQNLLRTGFPWIPLMDRDFFDNTQSNSVSMLVESPKIINQPSFLSYICDASIIFIYIYVYVYIYESHSIGVMNSSLWILPPFPTNPTIKATNRAAALPRHPQDQHHTTVLEGIGDAAAVDQTTGCIVLAKGIPPRGDPRLQPQRCGKMGCVSWGYHGNRYNIFIYIL